MAQTLICGSARAAMRSPLIRLRGIGAQRCGAIRAEPKPEKRATD